jgi:uroporphyrinogen III methyltransferase/synthase
MGRASAGRPGRAVTVYLVGAGPGDPGLLTRRGADLLARADVVVYDRLVDPALLALAPDGAELVDAGKRPAGSGGAARQADINALLVARGRAGRTVVRLKGGDPFLFGRGGEEAEALAAADVPWEPVPGVSSALAVPAYAGIPVTHRGLSASVTVVTGHAGDRAGPGGVDWASLARAGGTLVVLMGVATRDEVARRLMDAGRSPGTPVAVVQWGTTPAQRAVRTTLADLGGVDLGSPSVVVVGPVAALDLDWSGHRPLAGWSVAVTRPREQAGPTVAALSAAGARVVEVPVVRTVGPADGGEALRRAAASVGGYAWVVFTSANAVRRFVPLLRDGRALGAVLLAAVGEATASALAGLHLVADLVPAQAGEPGSGASGLVAAFPDAPAGGGRVLFPRAAGARRVLPDGLRAKGWEVHEVEAYRTEPAPAPPPVVVSALASADAVVFASPSAVDAYLGPGDGSTGLPVPPLVACIGPTTAAAARRRGLTVGVEAASPSPGGLVAALVAHAEGRAGGPGGATP